MFTHSSVLQYVRCQAQILLNITLLTLLEINDFIRKFLKRFNLLFDIF